MEVTTEIKDICQQIADIYKKKMADAGYDQSKDLYNFTWFVKFKNGIFELVFRLPDYWKYAENGRPPGKPAPYVAIRDWMRFKKLIPDKANMTKDDYIFLQATRKKIGREGIKGKQLLNKTINDDTTTDDLIAELEDELRKLIIDEEINTELEL